MQRTFCQYLQNRKEILPKISVSAAPIPVHTAYSVLIGIVFCANYKKVPVKLN